MNETNTRLTTVEPKSIQYRLYYDGEGKVLFYTCEQEIGDYIVIDKDTYIKGRHDIRVVDGIIIDTAQSVVLNKMEISKQGIQCTIEDVNIIVDASYNGKTQFWNTKLFEVKYG